MNEAQSGNGICSVLVILRKKKKNQKMLQKVLATYVRYVLVKLAKFGQIST